MFDWSCLVWQQFNSPKQKNKHSLVNWPPSFRFANIRNEFFGLIPIPNGNISLAFFGDQYTKYQVVPNPFRRQKWFLPHYLSTRLVVLAFLWAFKQTKVKNLSLKCCKVSCSLFRLIKRELDLSIHNQICDQTNEQNVTEHVRQNFWWLPLQSDSQLSYVMIAFRSSVHESTGCEPRFLVFGELIILLIGIQYLSPEQPNKTDLHQFVQQKRVYLQQAPEAARIHLQAAQLRRKVLYNFKLHGPGYKPGDNVWLHGFVTPKGWKPKLASPWKGSNTFAQCLNDVTCEIKNTVNKKETILNYGRLKPFLQRPDEVQILRREPNLFRETTSNSIQKPHFTSHKHCNCSQNLSDHFPLSPWSRSASLVPLSAVFTPIFPFCCCQSKTTILGSQLNHSLYSTSRFVLSSIASTISICEKIHFWSFKFLQEHVRTILTFLQHFLW